MLAPMASAVWVTAGAPLESGDGWRSGTRGRAATSRPRTPRVRTPGGAELQVIEGAWEPGPPPKGSKRRMGVQRAAVADATPGALYEVTLPEAARRCSGGRCPTQLPPEGVSLLIGSCFWINDDRDGFYASAVRSSCSASGRSSRC